MEARKKNRKKLTSSIIMKTDFLYLPVVTDAKIVPRTVIDMTEKFICSSLARMIFFSKWCTFVKVKKNI